MRAIQYPFVLVMWLFLRGMESVCELWAYIKEYESMRSKGWELMRNDKGDYYWIGYDD